MSFRATRDGAIELPAVHAYELVTHCAQWGVGAGDLLEGTGLTVALLQNPEARLALPTFADLVERARRLTGEPALAFSLGMQMRVSSHGFLGFAAMTSATLREALGLAERFSLTRTAAFGLSSYVEGDTASVVLDERLPPGDLREFAVITLLVGMVSIARQVTGKALSGVAECAFPEPPYVAPILARAGSAAGTMVFGRPCHRLVFDASILDLPLVTSDPAAMQLARAQCDRELAALSETADLVGEVRSLVARGAAIGSLDDVARRLHLSGRTLKRRLAERGTTFSAVAQGVRHQRALLLLADQRIPIADVAERLGYSDVANFTRAFRRWTSRTPAAYRKR